MRLYGRLFASFLTSAISNAWHQVANPKALIAFTPAAISQ